MSADTGRVKISRFCSDSEKHKQVLQETMIFFVLEINWLAARDTPFSSSKTTCNISATSCWVLKSKGTPLKLDSLRFKAHKMLDGLTGLLVSKHLLLLLSKFKSVADNDSDIAAGLITVSNFFAHWIKEIDNKRYSDGIPILPLTLSIFTEILVKS